MSLIRAGASVKRRNPQDDLDIVSLAQLRRHYCGFGRLGQPSDFTLSLIGPEHAALIAEDRKVVCFFGSRRSRSETGWTAMPQVFGVGCFGGHFLRIKSCAPPRDGWPLPGERQPCWTAAWRRAELSRGA
jgi:hypothetical protein